MTGVRATGSSKGYWIQDPNPDSNPATSEGVFVFTGSAPTVAAGDSVLVSGKVQEFYPLASGDTVATTSNLSITEIDQTGVSVVSSGNALPAPIVLGPATVPDTYAPDLGGGNIESTPIHPVPLGPGLLRVDRGHAGRGGRRAGRRAVGLVRRAVHHHQARPRTSSYRGGTLLTAENATPSGRLEVVPADGSNPEVSVGDVFTGATVGPLDYSQFGGYLIAATTLGTVQNNHLAPVVATGPAKKQLSIATYNVENLAPSDPASKFQALAQGIVTNLAAPDIIAVEEVQDNDGATDDGVVAADQTISKLTAAVVAAGGPHYDSREIDPVNDQDGGQPGGNIRVVFLYNPAVVTFVDIGAATVNRSTTGTQVVKKKGEPALTLSPGRIDPTNSVWNSSRKPLVGEFEFSGQRRVRHRQPLRRQARRPEPGRALPVPGPVLRGPAGRPGPGRARLRQPDPGHGQEGRRGRGRRPERLPVQPGPDDPEDRDGDGSGKPILTDLITTLPANQQYTYDFDGVSEVLDHILVSQGHQEVDYQVVHVNSEFANQASDHDPQVVDIKP